MISRLRFAGGNSSSSGAGGGNGATSTASSIFGATMSAISSGSILPGSSSLESAAATAAANASAASGGAGTTADAAPSPSSGSGDGLPPGWRLVSSRHTGKDYFLHLASGHTQWVAPTDADPKRMPVCLPAFARPARARLAAGAVRTPGASTRTPRD